MQFPSQAHTRPIHHLSFDVGQEGGGIGLNSWVGKCFVCVCPHWDWQQCSVWTESFSVCFTYTVHIFSFYLWECKSLHLLLTNQRLSIAPYVLLGLVHLCWGTCGADCVWLWFVQSLCRSVSAWGWCAEAIADPCWSLCKALCSLFRAYTLHTMQMQLYCIK